MRALVTAGLASLVVSCILAVSPETYGDRCRFAGEDGQCGACVAAACQPQVNEACADPALTAVEACATRHDASCTAIPPGALADCVRDKCAGVCRQLAGTSRTACKEPPLGDGSLCACTLSSAPNDTICDALAYPQTICCAPKGWPAEGLECSCKPLSCNPTADGCFCTLATTRPEQRTCGGGGSTCCVENDACTCRSRGCYAFETPVPSCAIESLGCAAGQIRVDSCSVR